MRILVVGASGLLGSHLLPALLYGKHTVLATSRDPHRVRFPKGVQPMAWDGQGRLQVPGGCDAIVNLAGERVIGRRWGQAQKERLRDSRVRLTQRLADFARSRPQPPVLVGANAVGYYGARPDGPCPEGRAPGEDFLATLCRDWQAAAESSPGRVATLRLGHVLAREGGYLGTLLPFARWGLAGRIGSGRQPMPWVHVEDVARAILWALEEPGASGPYNVVSPGAAGAAQRDFAKAVGRAIGRPLQAPIPAFALRLRFGAAAAPFLLGGQDARPERLAQAGFRFRHENLGESLGSLLA